MPFVARSVNWTLQRAIDYVRLNTGTIEQQESELYDVMVVDVIHRAIESQTGTMTPEVYEEEYRTTEAPTETSNFIDISGYGVAFLDIKKMSLSDATHGDVDLVPSWEFDSLKSHYSAAELADALFARVTVKSNGTDNKLCFETYRGSNVVTPGTLSFSFVRTPKKRALADVALFLDLSDRFMHAALEVAIKTILGMPKSSAVEVT